MNKPLHDRYLGTLFGLAYGDAFGAPFEFWNAAKIQEHFANNELVLQPFIRGNQEFPAGFTTDDTAQMICLAESLLENGFDLEDQFDRYDRWFREGYGSAGSSAYGIGQHTIKVLLAGKEKAMRMSNFDGSDHEAGGNGALMRSAPLALYYSKLDLDFTSLYGHDLIEKTIYSTYVTHNNKVNAWMCAIFNMTIMFILWGVEKQKLLFKVRNLLDSHLDLPHEINEVLNFEYTDANRDQLVISGYAPDTLKIAFWGFFTTDNYLDSIRKVMELGRDTDTFAAVTGALAGGYYGYEHIRKQVKTDLVLHESIGSIVDRFLKLP